MRNIISKIVAATGHAILGKAHQIRLVPSCILARGHLLIKDLPDMGTKAYDR